MKLLLFTFIAFFLFSCAHKVSKKPVSVSQEIKEQSNITYEEISNKLDLLVKEAIKGGQSSIDFLAGDFYLKASDASHSGDLQTASLLYEKLLVLDPNDEFIKRKYAVDLIKLGQVEKSLKIVKQVYQNSKDQDSSAGLLLGGLYSAVNKPILARGIYKEVLSSYPKSDEACLYIVKSFIDTSSFKEAKNKANKCQKIFSKKAIFTYYLGKIALKENKDDKALGYFKKALKIDSDFYQASIGMGLIYESRGKLNLAADIYRNYLELDPGNYTILSRFVQILFSEGKFKQVIPYAQSLVSLDPTNINLKVKLAILHTDTGNYDEAKIIFKEILQEVPGSDKVLFYLGTLYQRTANGNNAVEYFNRINEESSLFLESHVQIANILKGFALEEYKASGQGLRYKNLMNFLESAYLKHKENVLNFKVILVGFFEDIGKLDQAISVMAENLNDKNFTEDHHYYLGSLYEKNKEIEKGRDVVRRILAKNPENAHALNFIAYSMIDVGDNLDEGYRLVKKAIKLRPQDGYIRDTLGWFYFKKGMLEQALSELKKARELESSDLVIAKHLAVVYQELKSYALAKKVYTEALALCKDEKEINEVSSAIKSIERVLRLPASE